ncbi:MAG: efflux RND transporter permease subunit [Bacteroidota bacterium]
MKRLVTFFVTNPIWGNTFLALTLVFGLLALFNMRMSFFPEMEVRIITINVAYPGASPEEIEEGITTKIEQALEGLNGIKRITSTSTENISSIRIEAVEGTDMDELKNDVDNTVNSISSFPAGAEKPIVRKLKVGEMSGVAAFLSLTGPDDLWKLKEITENVKNDFLSSPWISQVQVMGYPEVEISVEVSEEKLMEYGLRFDEVVSAVRTNNIDLTGGVIKTKDEEYIIRMKARETAQEEIKKIVLRASIKGELITLGDVATVKYQFADRPFKSYLDGKRNVTIIVNKLPEEDLGKISDEISAYVENFNQKNKDHQLKIVFQFRDMLQERIDLLTSNGLMGFVLVLICLGFFLSLRVSFWVAFGIPVSFLGLFACGYLYGMTINMISLFGMILVVGILVDDGIVIAENIYSHFERGKPAMRAAIDGTMEVFTSVVSSVLTTVAAFALLMYVGGQFEMMREMAFAVVACLLFSLCEALLTLPQHLSHDWMLKPLKISWYQKIRNNTNRFIDWMRDGYAWAMGGLLRYYRITVFIPLVFVFVIVSFLITGLINFTFFPNIQFDDIKLEVAFKPGEREFRTEEFLVFCEEKVNKVRSDLKKEYGEEIITSVTRQIGNADGLEETGAHAGMLRIQIDIEGKNIESFAIAERIRNEIGPVKGPEKFTIGGEGRWGKPVAVMLSGKNNNEINEAKEYLKKKMQELGTLKDITDDSPLGTQEINIVLKEKAYLLKLTRMEIARQIRQGFFGDEAQRIIIGEDEVRIWVRYPPENRQSVGQLEEMKIKTLAGEYFPLKELVTFNTQRGEVGIKHYDGKRQITVEADLINSNASALDAVKSIEDSIIPSFKAKYPGVNTSFLGQFERAQESQGPLVTIFWLTILIIVIILALNFSSLMQAFIVLTVIPAGVMCALLGHGLEGKPVSLFSVWGIIALIGILVNDAVVMLDTYNRNIADGMKPKEAAFLAGKSRFRAVVLTSITTVAGLYPLILEDSFQAQFLIPMAIAVAHGLLWGTLFTMFFFPCVILFYNDIRRTFRWLWTGIKPLPEEVEPVLRYMRRMKKLEEESQS